MTPEYAIDLAYNYQRNMMTPARLYVGWIKEPTIAYEISSGEDPVSNMTMYGVSIVTLEDNIWKSSMTLNKCLHSKREALDYVERLRESENKA